MVEEATDEEIFVDALETWEGAELRMEEAAEVVGFPLLISFTCSQIF